MKDALVQVIGSRPRRHALLAAALRPQRPPKLRSACAWRAAAASASQPAPGLSAQLADAAQPSPAAPEPLLQPVPPGSLPEPRTVVLRTAEARVSLRWAVLDLPGSPQAVVVAAVAVGSEAQRAGVTPGDALLALSDPIRPSELWSLSLPGRGRAGASVRFVRDALRLRALPSVSLVLQPGACGPDPLIVTESGPAGAEAAAGPAAEEAESCALPTASQRRTAKRAAYMEVVAKRSDSSFFAALAAGVLATPAAILLWASNTGWLDPTQGGG